MEKLKETGIVEEIEFPDEVKATIEKNIIALEGPKGKVSRRLEVPGIELVLEGKKIIIKSKRNRKKEKKIVGTFKAHIKNMIKGATEGHSYQLKICSGHFPMNVSVSNNEFIIKNFLGEKTPRKSSVLDGAEIKIEGELVTVESASKEIAGQMAADIERLTKIRKKDLRVFQDGIYIINKDGKEIK